MRVRIIAPASREWMEAVEHYEEEQSDLGGRFWKEAGENIHWITRNSTLPRLPSQPYRRVNLKVFPYHIAYSIRDKERVIWAIACSYKKPEYWKERLS